MKILLMSPYPPPAGGIATWTKNLLTGICAMDYENEIIHHNTAYNLKEITRFDIWSRIIFGLRELRLLQRDLKIKLRDHHPDVIHLTSSASLAMVKDYFVLRRASKYGIPVVTHWRFGRIPEYAETRNWEWKLLSRIIRKSKYSIVIDERSYRVLINNGFTNVVKIPNFLALKAGEKIRKEVSAKSTRKMNTVLYVGHLIRNKGVYELVSACAALPDVKELIMVGEYETGTRDDLVALSRFRNNGEWLNITGNVDADSVYEFMSSATLLTLPSYTEGFPNVIIEAMAMGCPVVATDVGAIPEILAFGADEPCGVCIPSKNEAELKEAIKSLLGDPGRLQVLGENGINRVLANYTFTTVFREYDSVWQNSLRGKS